MSTSSIRRWVENPVFDLTAGQRYSAVVVLAFGFSLFAFGMPGGGTVDAGASSIGPRATASSGSNSSLARESGVAVPAGMTAEPAPVLAPEAPAFAPSESPTFESPPIEEPSQTEPAPAPAPEEPTPTTARPPVTVPGVTVPPLPVPVGP
jgi:hypothetical protein